MISNFARAALVGLALAFSATAAMAANNPIPGVDIVVKKNPGGIATVAATSDAKGQFSARMSEAGQYTLSTACPRQARCPARTVSVSASGVALKPNADGTFHFTVAHTPIVISGTIMSILATVRPAKSTDAMDGDTALQGVSTTR